MQAALADEEELLFPTSQREEAEYPPAVIAAQKLAQTSIDDRLKERCQGSGRPDGVPARGRILAKRPTAQLFPELRDYLG